MVNGVPGSSSVESEGLNVVTRRKSIGKAETLKKKNPLRFCGGFRRLRRWPARGEKGEEAK